MRSSMLPSCFVRSEYLTAQVFPTTGNCFKLSRVVIVNRNDASKSPYIHLILITFSLHRFLSLPKSPLMGSFMTLDTQKIAVLATEARLRTRATFNGVDRQENMLLRIISGIISYMMPVASISCRAHFCLYPAPRRCQSLGFSAVHSSSIQEFRKDLL